ncbi:MAG: SDR family oxidoreductase [Desulfurococcales archaeon]|nr:SDR family oxidoreductase [Desulfurococcales archaeon]
MVNLGLNGYRVIVTASTEGIGRGIVEVLLEQGAKVVINGRTAGKMEKTISDLSLLGEVYGVTGDLSVPSQAESIVDKGVEMLGGLDSLVYVTGSPKPGAFANLNWEDWDGGINLLIKSSLALTRRAIIHLKGSDNPSIVYSTSVAVKEPIPDIALSNVLRISVHGLVKTLARELGSMNIRVNAVMPGYIMTKRVVELAESRSKGDNVSVDEVIDSIGKGIPIGRIGNPRDVGYAVAFLISRLASYITGVSLPVDGGLLRSIF